jgi:nucleoside-diphosphate-sugar epimerase
VIHTAALHAPHVGVVPDAEFQRINVDGTLMVAETAMAAGVPRLVFTSTTALYGDAVSEGTCTFIDEETPPGRKASITAASSKPNGCWREWQARISPCACFACPEVSRSPPT